MKLGYVEKENMTIAILSDGLEIGYIQKGLVMVSDSEFWDIAVGKTKPTGPDYEYWIQELNVIGYVNANPIHTLNQAKALAEYHFNQD